MGLADSIALPDTSERVRIDHATGALVGSRCMVCGATSWPTRAVCHRCGAPETRETAFSASGIVLASTTVHVPWPGIETPYTLAQVKLDDGPVVFGHLRGRASKDGSTGDRVRLVVAPANTVPPFWFDADAGSQPTGAPQRQQPAQEGGSE
jgi:uncharacterized OB-fold protein